jgi:sarcosine oxidase subunit beta
MGSSIGTVLVVGGGVVGLNAAYRLAEKGVDRVVVVERGAVGDGSSSRSSGIVMRLMYDRPGVVARAKSVALFEQFDRDLDGYTFHQDGLLRVYDDEQAETWTDRCGVYREAGIDFERLGAEEAGRRFPDLRLADGERALFDPRGGFSEPEALLPALESALLDAGVAVREREAVVEVGVEDGRVSTVVTRERGASGGERTLAPDAVVCTVNAWTNRLLSSVGVAFPFENFVHERFVTRPLDEPPSLPVCTDHVREGYLRPTADGRLLYGTVAHDPGSLGELPADFEMAAVEPASEARRAVERQRDHRLPGVADAPFVDARAGLISVTPDTRPILGPVPGVDGLYVGSNFCSNGFGYAPVAGLLLAEYVVDGSPSIAADPWRPSRFEDEYVREFLARSFTHHELSAMHGAGAVREDS